MTAVRFRTGDTVHHRPSSEDWLLAYADYGTGYLSPCGWPDCEAQILDCSPIKAATDEESEELLAKLVASGGRRGRVAKAIAETTNAAA